ncbi:MAG: hypothetical protein AVDCRST_MAG93-7240 [uncultured Chloroflexia bacterium]|uniref:Uncharacterized protein n=1 Tax=uncultured Chloroflexia bacterium TaxID=1672391 RepID=A0A6J4MA24_9CHLR|nr:MAG: hypothetical protein AVDCRST_MAG93-7240 [uncultured Chloroflexia bacterium]
MGHLAVAAQEDRARIPGQVGSQPLGHPLQAYPGGGAVPSRFGILQRRSQERDAHPGELLFSRVHSVSSPLRQIDGGFGDSLGPI